MAGSPPAHQGMSPTSAGRSASENLWLVTPAANLRLPWAPAQLGRRRQPPTASRPASWLAAPPPLWRPTGPEAGADDRGHSVTSCTSIPTFHLVTGRPLSLFCIASAFSTFTSSRRVRSRLEEPQRRSRGHRPFYEIRISSTLAGCRRCPKPSTFCWQAASVAVVPDSVASRRWLVDQLEHISSRIAPPP